MIRSRPRLRRADPGDASAVRALTREAYAKWVPVISREPRPMTADYAKAVDEHWIDLHEDESGLAALIEMVPEAGYLLIENIAVREDRQGRGLATALLTHAEDVARQHGFAEIRLYTNAAFTSNLGFYRNRGFEEIGRELLADGGTMVHFGRAVS